MISRLRKIISWLGDNRNTLIRNSFLIPILLVVIMSISHVVSWYDLGNPLSWAIYLSVAVEFFALACVSAASIKISKGSIWFLFIMVTLVQIVGNIYFGYKEIIVTSEAFASWVELISPLFLDWEIVDHRRFLAAIQGGTLPIMSLTALHFYIQFTENLQKKEDSKADLPKEESTKEQSISDIKKEMEEKFPTTSTDSKKK